VSLGRRLAAETMLDRIGASLRSHGEHNLTEETSKPRYAIVIRVPRDVEVRIEDTYLSVIGMTKPTMGYHLTLLGPFRLSDDLTAPHLPAVTRLCREQAPFEVHLAGLGVYRTEDNNAVYLGVTEPEKVASLHTHLLEVTRDVALPENETLRVWTIEKYNPHVTLGLGMSDSELQEFLRLAQTRGLEASFTVNSIWLVAQDTSGPWEFVTEYRLGVPRQTPQP